MKQPTEHAKGNEFMRRDRYEGEIKFDNVNYSYPNQDANAIENISFKIAKGERVGLVGRVGSGKTTIGKLITKLFYLKQEVFQLMVLISDNWTPLKLGKILVMYLRSHG